MMMEETDLVYRSKYLINVVRTLSLRGFVLSGDMSYMHLHVNLHYQDALYDRNHRLSCSDDEFERLELPREHLHCTEN